MILDSIILKDIRSYSYQEIEFPQGITLFEGDIGSGKSTILMAIEFALFGLGSQKAESLLAKKAEDGYVILEFTVEGQKYEVKRALKRKQGIVSQDARNSYLKTDEGIEPLSPSELKQRILRILKFNEPGDPRSVSKIFRYAIFTPQEEMKKVLDDPRIRLETIRKTFGIEDYSIAAINAKEIAATIKNKAMRLEGRFSDLEQLEQENKISMELVDKIKADVSRLERSERVWDVKKKQITEKLEQLQNQRLEKVRLEETKKGLENKISDNKSSIESTNKYMTDAKKKIQKFEERIAESDRIKRPTSKTISHLEEEIRKFQNISKELLTSNTIASELKESISELNKKIRDKDKDKIRNKIKENEDALESTRQKLDKTQKEITQLREQKTRHQTNMENLKRSMDKSVKLGVKCPECEQDITEEHLEKLKVEQKTKQSELTAELKKVTDALCDTDKIKNELVKKEDEIESGISKSRQIIPQIEELEQKSTKLAQIEARITELQTQNTTPKEEFECQADGPLEYVSALKDALVEYENLARMIKEIKNGMDETLKQISKYQSDLESFKNDIIKNENEIQNIKEKEKSFVDIEDKIRRTEQESQEINQKMNNTYAEKASSKQSQIDKQKRIDENKNKIQEFKKYKEEHDKYLEYYEWLTEFFIPATLKIEKQVLRSIWQGFNEVYKKWYEILIEDLTKESRIEEDFTPIIFQDGYDQDVGYMSGGEKTSIALAYRLTLNSLMRRETDTLKSNLLILDEPTDGFSKTQLSKIRDVLDELKSQQILLVSHDIELETHVDNIFKISKEDGVSKITNSSIN